MLMSGPIVRRYGFPNFDKIFGERPLQHGADEPETADSESVSASRGPKKAAETAAQKTPEPAKGKKNGP
jgi:hypothetical protein